MENLKQSFARIKAWVKANPKKSAVIAVLIVVVAYFAIKRGATESGQPLSDGGDPLTAETQNESGLLGGFGGGEPAPVSSGNSDNLSSGGGFGGGDNIGGLFDSGFSDDFSIPSSDGFFGGFSGVGFDMSSPIESMAGSKDTVKSVASAVKVEKEIAPAIVNQKSSTGTTASKAQQKNPSPAYLAGKGQKFTGTYNGITYVNGYPVSNGVSQGTIFSGMPNNSGILAGVLGGNTSKVSTGAKSSTGTLGSK